MTPLDDPRNMETGRPTLIEQLEYPPTMENRLRALIDQVDCMCWEARQIRYRIWLSRLPDGRRTAGMEVPDWVLRLDAAGFTKAP